MYRFILCAVREGRDGGRNRDHRIVVKLSLYARIRRNDTPPKKVRSVHYAHILLYAFNETPQLTEKYIIII